jgi:hypothetical protein
MTNQKLFQLRDIIEDQMFNETTTSAQFDVLENMFILVQEAIDSLELV